MRSGAGLRMILNGEYWPIGEAHTGQRAIVEIPMREPRVGGQALRIDAVVVILGGDLHPTPLQIAHRLVAAMVAKFQLIGLGTQRAGDDLVS